MKYYGNISDNKDLVNKEYVDNHSGGGSVGKLNLSINSEEALELFSANQSTDSTLTLVGGTNITLTRDQTDRNKITITGSGGGGFDGVNSVSTVSSVPVDKKNCVATIDKGESLSFSSLASAFELNLYVIASPPVSGSLGTGAITIETTIGGYPVIYNGVYNSSSASYPIINLVTNVEGTAGKLIITSRTAATFHILFTGSIFFIDRYYFDSSQI